VLPCFRVFSVGECGRVAIASAPGYRPTGGGSIAKSSLTMNQAVAHSHARAKLYRRYRIIAIRSYRLSMQSDYDMIALRYRRATMLSHCDTVVRRCCRSTI
jgi:hypothetical protein